MFREEGVLVFQVDFLIKVCAAGWRQGYEQALYFVMFASCVQEVCRVLGLDSSRSRCPQLWIDPSWPPNRLTPRSKRSAPVWIFPMPAAERDALAALRMDKNLFAFRRRNFSEILVC